MAEDARRGRPYLVLAASVVVQMCLGGLYAWSVFARMLERDGAMTPAQTGLIFGMSIAVFALAMIPAGRLLMRWGPRKLLILSAVLFAVGYWVAGWRGGSFGPVLVGVGVLTGMALGFGYVCPLTVCAQWFPKHRGTATGLAVAGFGAGGALLSRIAEGLYEAGLPVSAIFQRMGIVYGLLILLAGACIVFPPGWHAADRDSLSNGRPPFRAWRRLALGMFAGTFGGLLVIGHLTNIGLEAGLDGGHAAAAVMWFALGNAAGRIVWGLLHDRLGGRTLPASLLWGGLSIALLALPVRYGLFIPAGCFVGFGFGACFVVYSAELLRAYGAHVYARLYPVVFLFYGLAALTAPTLGGYVRSLSGGYGAPILLAALAPLVGTAWVMPDRRRR